MRWRRRNKNPNYEIISREIPLSTIHRWYLYDTGLADANTLAEYVGLSRVSEEGDLKEQEDSTLRISRISELIPYIDTISDMSAETMMALQKSNSTREGLTDEDIESTRIIYKAVSMSTLIGALSIAFDLGILDSEAGNFGQEEMEIEYE